MEVKLYYDGYLQDTSNTDVYGSVEYVVPIMRWVNGTVTKAGYQAASFSQYINTWDTWSVVTLYTDNETPGSGDAYGNNILTFRDAKTDAIIPNIALKIYSDSGYTSLFQAEWSASGVITALVPLNTPYYYRAEAANYNTISFSSNITTSPTYATHYMTRINYASDIDGDGIPDYMDSDIDGDGIPNSSDDDIDGDGAPNEDDETPEGSEQGVMLPNLHIWVYSTSGAPIDGAVINVVSDSDSASHITNSTGHSIHYYAELMPGTSRVYSVSVSRGGYESQSASVTVSTAAPSISFYLAPSTGATATPTPTAIYTPVVLPTWSGTNGTPGTYKEQFLNFTMSQFGVGQFEAGVLIGLVLTLLSAVFVGGCLAGYGAGGNSAGIGAMIGGAFGWIASGMLGFIPLWALIVTVALVAMIFLIFLRGGGSGGG